MAFSELSSQELDQRLRIYMASPEGDIRPEIHALWSFWVNSIRDSDCRISVSPSDGYDVANLFWDLYEPSRLVPQFDEDILESLESHVLLSFGAWSFDNSWPEDCKKWVADQINRLTDSRRHAMELPREPDWQERFDQVTQMTLLLPHLHDVGHICSQSLAKSDRDCEQFILEYLEWLYELYKVPYEPDSESGDAFGLDAYLHIAATRAFRIKENQGLSDDTRQCLTEVERTAEHIEAEGGLNFEECFAPYHSTQAIAALAYAELSRVSRVDGDFAKALYYLAKAAKYYDFIVMSNNELIGDPENLRVICDDRFDIDSRLRRKLEENLTGLRVYSDEAADVFRLIKESPGSVANWRQIADDCRALQIAWFISGRDDDITDEYGIIVTWAEFWAAARAWATAQLSPSEYRKMREDDEQHAAETRLKNYFFDNSWSYLPERAQGRLINADLIWNSPQRVSRESILNELLRATEEMCEQFVVQPLVNDSTDILSIEAQMAERGRSLGVRDYINICELRSMPSLLSDRNLTDDEIKFMTEDLPSGMRNLVRARNPAEHETGTSLIPPALVDSAYRLFLGIGRKGVLPELARIGRKLQGRRR